MTKQTKWIIIVVVVFIIALIAILKNFGNECITAGCHLDRIVELRQDKQDLLDQIKSIENQITEERKVMDSIQYNGLEYLGFTQEAQSPQRTWTQAPELTWKVIQM